MTIPNRTKTIDWSATQVVGGAFDRGSEPSVHHESNTTSSTPRPTRSRTAGIVLVYVAVSLMVLLGLLSFAVDFGRVQSARAELQTAVDVAARYAVTGALDSSYASKAQAVAAQNYVDSTPLTLLNDDVEVGWWDTTTKAFTANTTNKNAVRVTGVRLKSRNTAIPTVMAALVGMDSVDLHATSVALLSTNAPTYGVVGINSISMSGSAKFDSNTGEPATLVAATNGAWSASGSTSVTGNIFYAASVPSVSCTGTKTQMPSNLVYAQPTTPSGTYFLGHVSSSSNTTLAGGTYSASSVNISGGTITLTGDVDVYVSGSVSISGGTLFNTNGTSYKLRIYLTAASGFSYSSSNILHACVYAPTSTANISSGQIVGSLIAKSISISSGCKIRYDSDLALDSQYAPTGGATTGGASGSVATVK